MAFFYTLFLFPNFVSKLIMFKSTCYQAITVLFFTLSTFYGFTAVEQIKSKSSEAVYFTENKGQILDQFGNYNSQVNFLGVFHDLNVQIRMKGWSYETFKTENSNSLESITNISRVDFNFINPSNNISITSRNKVGPEFNYYGEHFSSDGIKAVKSYSKVEYLNVWDGVNVEFVVVDDKPKYNIHVESPSQLSQIAFGIYGADNVRLIDNELHFKTKNGKITEHIPLSFITTNENKEQNVQVEYRIKGNILSFELLDQSNDWKHLTIDPNPQLEWNKSFGDSPWRLSQTKSIELNSLSEVYSVGWTNSSNNIATAGAHESTLLGAKTVGFAIKTDKNGNQIWGTYYGSGGLSGTEFHDVALMGDTQLVVVGHTITTAGLTTTGTFQSNSGGGTDVILVKFDSSGTRKWGSYFGGTNDDYGTALLTDTSNNIYFTGKTNSTDTIASAGAFKSSFGGVWDGYVAKFNTSGGRVWSTYYGSTSLDELEEITLDKLNNIYVVGSSRSTTGISTTGSHQATHSGGTRDGVFAKFNSSGTQIWSSYFGGTSFDYIYSIFADSDTSIYMVGTTNSSSGISTPNSRRPIKSTNSTYDGFVTKFSLNGIVDWSTYVHGDGYAVTPLDVYVKNDTSIFVSGEADGGIRELTFGFYHNYSGNEDRGFILKFNAKGKLKIATDLSEQTESHGVRSSSQGKIYVGGERSVSPGGVYARLSKYMECPPRFTSRFLQTQYKRCIDDTLSLKIYSGSGTSYAWSGPNNFSDTGGTVSFDSLKTPDGGIYNVTVTDVNGCQESYKTVVRLDSVNASLPTSYNRCKNQNFNLSVFNTSKQTWHLPNGSIDTNNRLRFPFIQHSDSGYYGVKVQNSSGCKDSLWTRVFVSHTNVEIDTIPILCEGDVAYFKANPIDGLKFEWFSVSKSRTISQDTMFAQQMNLSDSGLYFLYYADSNWCRDTASVHVTVRPKPIVTVGTGNSPCPGGVMYFNSNGGVSYKWSGPAGFTRTIQNPSIFNASRANIGTYTVSVTNQFGCIASKSVQARILDEPRLSLQNNSPVCEGDDLTMSITGASSYVWTSPTGSNFTFPSWRLSNAQRSDNGTYTVVGTSAGGCKTTRTATAVINYVDPIATSNSPIKVGDDLILNGSGGSSYFWSGPSRGFFGMVQNIPTVDKSHAGLWNLNVTKGNCESDTSITVVIEDEEEIIDPNPDVSVELLDGQSYLNAYPIPSSGAVFVEIQSSEQQKLYFGKVFNVTGQAIYNLPLEFKTNEVNQFHLNVPGTYQLRILDEDGNIQATKRIIIAN